MLCKLALGYCHWCNLVCRQFFNLLSAPIHVLTHFHSSRFQQLLILCLFECPYNVEQKKDLKKVYFGNHREIKIACGTLSYWYKWAFSHIFNLIFFKIYHMARDSISIETMFLSQWKLLSILIHFVIHSTNIYWASVLY